MRHFTLATGLVLAAAAFAISPALAEIGGPLEDGKGNCRQYGSNNQQLTFSYWAPCPSHEPRRGGIGTRTVRVTSSGTAHATHHKKHT